MKLKTLINFQRNKKPIFIKNNDPKIYIMSFNIRCINKNDTGKKEFKYRAPLIRKLLEEENPDIIGFQEVKVKQFGFIKKILNNFGYIYKKRDDTKEGEANPIFYKKNRFELILENTFWLSSTYKVMSNTFKGKCIRICTYCLLKDKNNNKQFFIFNTHLDHMNPDARVKGIKLIKKIIKKVNTKNYPYIITGDMNDFYKSATIKELFVDTIDSSKFKNQQNISTFHNYGTENQKIDYIALSKNIKQIGYKVIKTKYNNVYPSDHFPIEAIIIL